jgi:hypothetical protein
MRFTTLDIQVRALQQISIPSSDQVAAFGKTRRFTVNASMSCRHLYIYITFISDMVVLLFLLGNETHFFFFFFSLLKLFYY